MTTAKAIPFLRNRLIRDAINQAIYDAMREDPSIYILGEGAWVKAHYDAPQILAEFPERIVTLPISEDGNTNFAVGASLLGIKPIVNHITADFTFRAMDSIVNTAAKLNFVLPDSEPRRTIVIQAEFLTGGPTTGQRNEMLFARIPGLNVVIPSIPRDAYQLMRQALAEPGITLFFEDRQIEDSETLPSDFCTGQMTAPFKWSIRSRNYEPALVILTYGLMRQRVESVLATEKIEGALVYELCTLSQLPIGLIGMYIRPSGKLLIVEPDIAFGGIGAEIIAQLHEQLDRPFKAVRLGGPREVIPASRDGQARMLPSREEILEAIRGLL